MGNANVSLRPLATRRSGALEADPSAPPRNKNFTARKYSPSISYQEEKMDTRTAVTAFLTQAHARGLSPKTLEAYQWATGYIRSGELPEEPGQVENILGLAAQRLAPESLRNLYHRLRTFYRWTSNRYAVPDPTTHVAAPRRPAALPKALNSRQVQQLIGNALTNRDRFLVLVPLDTGLRLAETAQIRKADLGATIRVNGKGAKTREIPISPSLVAGMLLLGDDDHIWTTRSGPIHFTGIKTAYRRIFARAGVRGGPHRLRHTFATEYLRAGGDLYRLSRILGHSNVRTTERYLHLVTDDLVAEHRRISPALPYLDQLTTRG